MRYNNGVNVVLLIVAIVVGWQILSIVRDLDPRVRQSVFRTLMLLGLAFAVLRFGYWAALALAIALAVLWRLEPLVRRVSGGGRSEGGQRSARPSTERTSSRGMTRQQALAVLGLEDGATRDEILSAYRALMSRVHPDRPGGSNYLASQINEARSVLLSSS